MAWALGIALWTWLAAGLVTVGFAGYGVKETLGDADQTGRWLLVPIATAGIGILVLALYALGHPVIALWLWRVASIAYLGSAIALAFYKASKFSAWAHTANAVNIVAAAVLVSGSVVAQASTPVAAGLAIAPNPEIRFIRIDGVDLWHALALGTLALATVIFIILFVRMVERGISPQVETHWGGLGGGIGGWRMSQSLTYLAAATAFGILFAVFVMQLEKKPKDSTQQAVTGSLPRP